MKMNTVQENLGGFLNKTISFRVTAQAMDLVLRS